ncbi:MAG: hypothetical protein WBC63_02105 [Candidatus Bipolaricaulia bacterium]
MARYFVRFRVETLASIAESHSQQQQGNRPIWKFSWTSDGARLVLHDASRDESGVSVHEGLSLDMDVPAGDMDEAISRAQNLTEGLVNLISYTTAAACSPATLKSAYEIPRGQADVDVVWVHQRSRGPLGDLRPIDADLLNTVYSLYDKADEATKWRISQAAQWLRKGDLELETVGQFIAYWEGLEAASWALLDILCHEAVELFPTCSKCKHQLKECPKCKKPLGRLNDMAGVAELFERLVDGGRETHKRIRTHRGQLFHGGKKLKPGFLDALREDLQILREALALAIGECLGLEEVETKLIAGTQPRRATRPTRVKVFGKLAAFEAPDLERPDLQPFVEHEPEEKYSVTSEGKLNVAFAHTLTMRNAAFQAEGFEMWGDEHAFAKD